MYIFNENTPFFDYTPKDVIKLIFSWLDDENSLLILFETCKAFSEILHEEALLKNLGVSAPNFVKRMALDNQKLLFKAKQAQLKQEAESLIKKIHNENPQFKDSIDLQISEKEYGVSERLKIDADWLTEEKKKLSLINVKLKQKITELGKAERISYQDLREFKKQLEEYTLTHVKAYAKHFRADKFFISAFVILALFGIFQYFGIPELAETSRKMNAEFAQMQASPAYSWMDQDCDNTNPDYQNCLQHYNAWNAANNKWLGWFLGELLGSFGVAAVLVVLGMFAWDRFAKQKEAAAKASVTNLDDTSKFSAWSKVKENYAEFIEKFLEKNQINTIEDMKNFVDKFLTADSPLALLKQEGAILEKMLNEMVSTVEKQVKHKKYSPYFTQRRSKEQFYSKSDSFFKRVDEILKDKDSRVVEIPDDIGSKRQEPATERSPLLS